MAKQNKLSIDLSGQAGLVERYQGDVNDTSAQPHLRHMAGDGQMADGIYNPMRYFGYMSPANNLSKLLSSSFNANLVATAYDSINDELYLAEEGATVWVLDDLDPSSVSSDIVVNVDGTETLTDLEIYEIYGRRMLFYSYNISGLNDAESNIGVKALDEDSGIYFLDSVDETNTEAEGTVTAGGAKEALAIEYTPATALDFDAIKVPLTVASGDNGGYTIEAAIQKDSFADKDGSYDFNGVENNLAIVPGNQTNIPPIDDFTIEAWVNVDDIQSRAGIVTCWDSGPGGNRTFDFSLTTGGFLVRLNDASLTEENYSNGLGDEWTYGDWHHLAVTRDASSGTITYYVDGQNLGTDTGLTGSLRNDNITMVLGSRMSGSSVNTDPDDMDGSNFLDGRMAEVRVWDDVRTTTEIQENMRKELTGSESNLVAYWKLDGDYTDETSNNNDLTTEDDPSSSTQKPQGQPDGTDVETATVNPTNLAEAGAKEVLALQQFTFSSVINIAKDETFWIVVQPQTFGNMSGSDEFNWLGSQLDPVPGSISEYYDGTYWRALLDDDDEPDVDLSVQILLQESQEWFTEYASGDVVLSSDGDIFMVRADNGFMYVFDKNRVHRVNGGVTGGGLSGDLKADVLRFPSYYRIVDAVDTRGRMYIAVQEDPVTASDDRTYSQGSTGVYVWDRLSNVIGMHDFIPFYGVRDVRRLYITPQGSVRAICTGNDRFTEIRSVTGSPGAIIQTLGLEAYPQTRDSFGNLNNFSMWLGKDGIFYAHGSPTPGEPERLFKIGDMTSNTDGTFETGIIFVGHEDSSQSREGVFFSYTDNGTTKLRKWLPHSTGTIDSIQLKANSGDVYTPVYYMPTMADIGRLTVYCIPTENSTSNEIAEIKVYINQKTSPEMTLSVTEQDASRGYLDYELNLSYVNSIQLEIEFDTSQILGNDDFRPSLATISYEPTTTKG